MSLHHTISSAPNARLTPPKTAEIQGSDEQNSLTLLCGVLHPTLQDVLRPSLPFELLEADSYRIGLIPVDNLRQVPGSGQAALRNTDSVVVLPITWKELVLRVNTHLDKPKANCVGERYRFGAVQVDFASMEASCSGREVRLTALQFKALRYFVANPFRVISRDELLDRVWGLNHYPTTRTVDNLVLRLRQTLELNPAKPAHFYTVHGSGYKFIPYKVQGLITDQPAR